MTCFNCEVGRNSEPYPKVVSASAWTRSPRSKPNPSRRSELCWRETGLVANRTADFAGVATEEKNTFLTPAIMSRGAWCVSSGPLIGVGKNRDVLGCKYLLVNISRSLSFAAVTRSLFCRLESRSFEGRGLVRICLVGGGGRGFVCPFPCGVGSVLFWGVQAVGKSLPHPVSQRLGVRVAWDRGLLRVVGGFGSPVVPLPPPSFHGLKIFFRRVETAVASAPVTPELAPWLR
jgi:hypothetical protein